MSTSRPSTSRWSKPAAAAGALGLVLLLAGSPGSRSEPPAPQRDLPPFLQLFKGNKEPPVVGRDVAFPSAAGPGDGYLARPGTPERLPALLLIPGDEGLTDWSKECTRDLAGVGYVALAVAPRHAGSPPSDPADEQALTQLWAAVRWLRRRPDVHPERVGVVGLSRGGRQALALAAAAPVRACVVCDGPVPEDPALPAGLRGTVLLGLFAGREPATEKALPAFRKALAEAHIPHKIHVYDGAGAGFLGPPARKSYDREAADRAWVEVYEFLGKYVEDAPPEAATAPPAVATTADIMRSVNEPTGVRGALIRALEQEPAGPRQWERIRADAALVAEAGNLLHAHTPPRGVREDWLEQARRFTAAAETIVSAADRQDYPAARRGLKELAERCAACHAQHR